MKLPVKDTVSDLKQFLLSQYFYDGLKITFGVVLPSIVFYQYGLLETGITFSLGALYVSITDNPGPVIHKRNAMLAANLFIFLTALIVGMTNRNSFLLSIDIVLLCFFFSMFTVYGARASAVGIAALLTMIIGIDQHLSTYDTFFHAACLLGGGIWYMLFSLSLNRALPYRPAEQTLGECMDKIAGFIRIKADFYDPETDLEKNQEKLMLQQIQVSEQLNNVREILFKTRELLKDSSAQGNRLLMTFIETVDLYEQSMENHGDYQKIREEFSDTPLPETFRYIILNIANELEQAATSIHNHEELDQPTQSFILLEGARFELDQLEKTGRNIHTLKRIWVNLKNVAQKVQQIYNYQQKNTRIPLAGKANLDRYVSRTSFDLKLLVQNLSFRSAVFRHSVRMSLVCLLAFLFARYFYTGHHSYWILLTILVILKPGFSQTRQRNIERIIGTLAGGLMGILILYFVKDVSARFWLLILFMLLCYSFIRIRYVVSVFFMTPFILIMFSFIGHNNDMLIVKERIIDTFIGAGIAALASYFILPTWESEQIRQMMADMVHRNYVYLKTAVDYTPDAGAQHRYKLARKEMYVSASNLSSAFQRMLNEPKRKRQHVNETNKFILVNNLFASYTAALGQKAREGTNWNAQEIKELRKVFHLTAESYTLISGQAMPEPEPVLTDKEQNELVPDLAVSQLIQVSNELKKISGQLNVNGNE